MNKQLDKLMDGLANLALAHGDLKAKVDRAVTNSNERKDRLAILEDDLVKLSDRVTMAEDAGTSRWHNCVGDITGITDSLRDCNARLDGHGRSLGNISARLNAHKEIINHNANDGEIRLTKLETAQKATDDKVVTLQLTERVARFNPPPPPIQPKATGRSNQMYWMLVGLCATHVGVWIWQILSRH